MSQKKMQNNIKPNDDFKYYSNTVYWNDFELVGAHTNKLISGNESINWIKYIKNKYGSFGNMLIINCGNGWVEREFYKQGIIKAVDGFDCSHELIDQAITESKKIGLISKYTVRNCNDGLSKLDVKYEAVLNHAAMHHVAFINRLSFDISRSLTSNGFYFGFDYVGAHRNQYSMVDWINLVNFNNSLPNKYKKNLIYPHFETMIHTDPTEAIHSELQVDILKRYFNIEEFNPIGGMIAYNILFNNKSLFNDRNKPDGINIINKIINFDNNYLKDHPESNLFAFYVGTPLSDLNKSHVSLWDAEEMEREKSAVKTYRYYHKTDLEVLYSDFDNICRELTQNHSVNLNTDLKLEIN
jgi:hypothetical protein